MVCRQLVKYGKLCRLADAEPQAEDRTEPDSAKAAPGSSTAVLSKTVKKLGPSTAVKPTTDKITKHDAGQACLRNTVPPSLVSQDLQSVCLPKERMF